MKFIDFFVLHKTIVVVIFVIVMITAGVVFYLMTSQKSDIDVEFDEGQFPAIRVMIYNGCGFMGVANNVRAYITRNNLNISVVGIGNTRRFVYDESLIVVKQYDPVDLRRLQVMTGIQNVVYALNENYLAPFIIIAGRDYQMFFDVGWN